MLAGQSDILAWTELPKWVYICTIKAIGKKNVVFQNIKEESEKRNLLQRPPEKYPSPLQIIYFSSDLINGLESATHPITVRGRGSHNSYLGLAKVLIVFFAFQCKAWHLRNLTAKNMYSYSVPFRNVVSITVPIITDQSTYGYTSLTKENRGIIKGNTTSGAVFKNLNLRHLGSNAWLS
ncbi:hypothetical protein BDB01DRAFT_837821 [Pilobolus umbonatus]|nr:hypothetical protein BDB01DRAFT_837821 [Pilobolus umbonatus]